MEKKLLRMLSKQQEQQQGVRKVYVKRMHNKGTLSQSIRQSMPPNKEMSMQDVLAALQATGLYKTRSSYFYTMVNNKLNRDPKIKKTRRGKFMLVQRVRKPSNSRTTSTSSSRKTQKKDQANVVAA
jgi:hypothetical protein